MYISSNGEIEISKLNSTWGKANADWMNFLFQLAQQVPALKSDGSDGGVIVPDFDLTPSFYKGLPRFAVRPSPVTQWSSNWSRNLLQYLVQLLMRFALLDNSTSALTLPAGRDKCWIKELQVILIKNGEIDWNFSEWPQKLLFLPLNFSYSCSKI